MRWLTANSLYTIYGPYVFLKLLRLPRKSEARSDEVLHLSHKIIGPDNPTCQLLPKAQSSEEDGMGKAGKVKEMVEDRLCERGVCVWQSYVSKSCMWQSCVCDKAVCQRVVCDKVVCDKAVCEPAQCRKCHACHTKWRSMPRSATPATQSEGGCHEVPRLPRKTRDKVVCDKVVCDKSVCDKVVCYKLVCDKVECEK